jgi:Fe-S oxidoreductase
VFYICALIAVIILFYNLRRFLAVKIGKKDPDYKFKLLPTLYNLIYTGILQRRVFRVKFTYASIMHFLIAFGFFILLFATTVGTFVSRGIFISFLPHFDVPWFAALNDTGGLMVFIGTSMALYRRHITKLKSLPQDSYKGRGNLFGDTGILLIILLLVIGGYIAEAARLSIQQPITAQYSWIGYPISNLFSMEFWSGSERFLWWSHGIVSLIAIALIPNTKIFHTIASTLNIALTNRELRGKVRAMHVSNLMEDPNMDVDEISLGSNKLEDFTWKQLLDSVACTECGRCSNVCPAYNTDKLLSPMKIITDIRHELYDKYLNKKNVNGVVGKPISEMELWSCTTCGACMEECPVLIDHIPTFTDMRRYLVLSEGKPHSQAADSLEKTMNTGNPWGFSPSERTKWATDAGINLPLMSEKKEADVLYWVGCAGSYDPRNQIVAKAMIKILEAANVDYAVLGNEESCTGDSARRLGEEYLFETMALQNIETFNKYKFKKIITPCPHCFHTIGNEYGDFDGNYEVQHHSQFIMELINSGKLKLNKYLDSKITYHDACYLGRHNAEYKAPREIIGNIIKDGKLIEMDRNKENSFCCGAGGGNMWYDIEDGDRINYVRFQEAIDTGVDVVATACSFCTFMMDDALKVKGKEDTMQVLDIAEMVATAL